MPSILRWIGEDNDMTEKHTEPGLPIAIPNGVILMLIGVLVLLTPLVEPIARAQLPMDLVAGFMLVVGGAVSIGWGVRRRRRITANPQRRQET